MIVDLGDKIVMRGEMSGTVRSVAFIDYTENAEDQRVVTGQLEVLPHLDPYATGDQVVSFLREKYPRPDWSMETQQTVCRPEYVAMIERSISDGNDYYDEIGLIADETQAVPPTSQIWGLLHQIDQRIADTGSDNPA